jgi:DNA end-binding protein Ku
VAGTSRENLLRIIKAKVKGKPLKLEPSEEPRQAEVVDLMERLRRSLAQSGGARKPRSAAPKRAVRKPAAKKRATHAA